MLTSLSNIDMELLSRIFIGSMIFERMLFTDRILETVEDQIQLQLTQFYDQADQLARFSSSS